MWHTCTMGATVAIQVPPADAEDLRSLLADLVSDAPLIESRPFDGESVSQVVVVLSTFGTSVFKAWLRARVDLAKNTSVSIDGMQFNGVNPGQIEQIMQAIDQHDER